MARRRKKFGLWLTRVEAAQFMRVSERTIYSWLENGLLTAHEVEGYSRTKIARRDLEELKNEAARRGISVVTQLSMALRRESA